MKTPGSNAGAASMAAPSKEVAQQYRMIAEMQRPRSVRMTRQGKLSVATMAVALLVFAGVLVVMVAIQPPRVTRFPRPVAFALPLGLIAFVAFVAQRALDRQWQLLTNGDLIMARVTNHWDNRKGRRIQYEFTPPDGKTFSLMTVDNSRQLLESMSVPVFYDKRDPKKQVALCASFYEIVLS